MNLEDIKALREMELLKSWKIQWKTKSSELSVKMVIYNTNDLQFEGLSMCSWFSSKH